MRIIEVTVAPNGEVTVRTRAGEGASFELAVPLSLAAVEVRLRDAGIEFGDNEFDGRRVLFCQDPAGNRWELRGGDEAPQA